ncbi:hypothetical protein EB796_019525 [Bugula neritina]|uniref:Uncharacterized protein n=1 Tax=Bugula neritina TaxID=10212 RepID=A0A7J7J9D2_BUGNE|nr:hypothetical protein EB796_019525 [Bugula neritina]
MAQGPSSNFLTYLQCYFLTVSYSLGAGVLGLPVTLARAGLTPFLFMMTICLVAQIISIILITDAIQKLVYVQLHAEISLADNDPTKNVKESYDGIPLAESSVTDESCFSDGDSAEERSLFSKSSSGLSLKSHSVTIDVDDDEMPPVNLYLLLNTFLPRALSYAGNIHFIWCLCTAGISYALAGSQAWAEVIHISSLLTVIPFFCWLLNSLAVFGKKLVSPLVSVLTLFKGSLLLVAVIIAFAVSTTIHNKITSNFQYIQDTYLIVTVAIGGAYFTLPFLFTKIKYVEHEVRYFRLSVIFGLITVYILEILWCWATLDVVPQIDPCSVSLSQTNNGTYCLPPDYTLQSAAENGEISTIPFTKVINSLYPQYSWVATIISLFIMVSITVSYLFNSTILCHTVEGVITSWWKESWNKCDFMEIKCQNVTSSLANIVFLSVIFIVAMFNPKIHLQYIVIVFFMTASIYDIVVWISESV